jgi:hypothetical protein
MATVPRIENRWTCIATKTGVALASVASSYFQEQGVYVPVFEFPAVDAPYSPINDLGHDGYIARVVGTRAATTINNSLARIQPRVVLLLGLTETEKSYFRAYLPREKLVEINTIEDLAALLPLGHSHSDVVACRSSQIIEGLLLAKFTRKRLVVDDGAPLLEAQHLHAGEGVLVVENGGTVSEVAAINYAFAINADVVLVPPIDRQELRELPRQLHAWSNDRSDRVLDDAKRKATSRIKGITFRKYKFATFFTVGLPYGLFINNVIPCTHVLRDVDCGAFIAENMVDADAPLVFGSALLFSPQHFPSDETDDLAKVLDDSNYVVELLLGKDATLKRLDNYGSFFPFDVLHICAHGGETDGYYTIRDFTDRQGGCHRLEYYEVVGASPSRGDMVHVTIKMIFVSLDGHPWMSKPLKSYPKYVFEDMRKAITWATDDDVGVKRTSVDEGIATSCHIKCHDSIHQGDFQSLAGFGRPIVFNNTCSSSHEMAASLIGAGARCYIGTLWSIGNATATQAAGVFYQSAARQGNVLTAFFEMSKTIVERKYQDIYILWGLHLASFRKPSEKSEEGILKGLITTFSLWWNKMVTAPDPEIKRKIVPILRFLSNEILRRVSDERLAEIKNFDPSVIEDLERSFPSPLEDEFSRGVIEMEVISEERGTGGEAP